MLFLLFKNFMWAAWWPYYTMLLAMEKAAAQAVANRPKSPRQAPQARPEPPSRPAPQARPEPQIRDRGVVRDEETSMAANDAFMKPEIPQALHELMKMSIEHAMRAFETFVSTRREGLEVARDQLAERARDPLCAQRQDCRDHPAECRGEFRSGDEARRVEGRRSGD
jgi:hypothetical protein